jgi:hypothetical protein
MRQRFNFLKKSAAAVSMASGLLLGSSNSFAAVTITIRESGSNVVVTASGSINTTGLTSGPNSSTGNVMTPTDSKVVLGVPGSNSFVTATSFDIGLTSDRWSSSSTGDAQATTVSGDVFAYNGSQGYIMLPSTYTSGTNFSSENTYANQSFDRLRLRSGTYIHSWGTDSITTIIGTPPPTVSTAIPTLSEWAMIFLASLMGLFAFARIRRQS